MPPEKRETGTLSVCHPYREHYMKDAFLGFVSFASKHLTEQFEAESGPIKLGTTVMDRMIDKATGYEAQEAQRFVDWCVTQFGTPEQIEGGGN